MILHWPGGDVQVSGAGTRELNNNAAVAGGTFDNSGSLRVVALGLHNRLSGVVTGSAISGGRLHGSLLDGYRPVVGDVYTFLIAAGITGAFDDVVVTGFSLLPDTASMALVVISTVPLPASVWLLSSALLVLQTRVRRGNRTARGRCQPIFLQVRVPMPAAFMGILADIHRNKMFLLNFFGYPCSFEGLRRHRRGR